MWYWFISWNSNVTIYSNFVFSLNIFRLKNYYKIKLFNSIINPASLGLPLKNIIPSFTIYTLSTILSVSLTLWSVIRTPIFFCFNFFIIIFISSIETGSIPVKGSSRRRCLGREANVLAIYNLRLSPPDKTIDLDFLTWLISNSLSKLCNIMSCLFLSFSTISIIEIKLSSTFIPLKIDGSWGK